MGLALVPATCGRVRGITTPPVVGNITAYNPLVSPLYLYMRWGSGGYHETQRIHVFAHVVINEHIETILENCFELMLWLETGVKYEYPLQHILHGKNINFYKWHFCVPCSIFFLTRVKYIKLSYWLSTSFFQIG